MQEIVCNLCSSPYYRVRYRTDANVRRAAQANLLPYEYKITEEKRSGVSLRIVQCARCGLVYVSPQVQPDEILRMYRAMRDDEYLAEEKGRRIAARILIKKLIRLKSRGEILDVGCAAGFLLDEARKSGWNPAGVELSSWAASYAREKLGLTVHEGTLLQPRFPSHYFDAVIMNDMIEHSPNPRMVLEETRRILKNDGVVCVSTPDINSFLSHLLRARWWGIQQAHLYYFSRKTLCGMLDATGFTVLKFTQHTRVFSREYLSKRIGGYNPGLRRAFDALTDNPVFHGRALTVNFGDQIEVFARKKRSLVYVKEDDCGGRACAQPRKMKALAVLPAYNAARTLAVTVADIPKDAVDDIILVDDASRDDTVKAAESLGLKVFRHERNKGYGGNQKTCYTNALRMGADIVVMVHPDYQYDPISIPELIRPIVEGRADAVFGSRMMKGGALEGGMPLWKHNANILLTALENVVLGTYLTEYHSGFRAYSARYLRTVNFMANGDGFVFDTEIIVQGLLHYLKIEEIPIKTRYFDEASSIKFRAAVVYGCGILRTLLKYILHTRGIVKFRQFE